MLFNSWEFILFLPIVVILYYLSPQRFRWILLLVASCAFYMYFVPKYILILFLLIAIDYVAAIFIHSAHGRKRKLYLIISLIANISLLAHFKYIHFLGDTLTEIFGWFGINQQVHSAKLILPIGLSFHTFQSMAYTIEVYKGRQEPERHLGIYAVYVLFFPQMVAGPIERFATLGNQLKQYHVFKTENIVNGLRLILFGLFIKMAVADQISPLVDAVYNSPLKYNGISVIGAMLLFSIQIYADFWGYSTIALGSACMMGIRLMDNFKAPYLATSISTFWSRWHISLSTWFKDYVYIPLGGNRTTVLRWCINILIVFGLSGLWHGANWTFVIWGLIHGLMYLIERLLTHLIPQQKNIITQTLGWLFTFIGVTLAWVFFRSNSFEQAFRLLNQTIVLSGETLAYSWQVIAGCALIVLADVTMRGKRFDEFVQQCPVYFRWLLYALLLFGITIMTSGQDQPFIYFQF